MTLNYSGGQGAEPHREDSRPSSSRSTGTLPPHLQRSTHLLSDRYLDMVGRLAGGIAHALNNQLTVIQCNCDLMLQERRPEQRPPESLAEIQRAGHVTAGIIRQLLTFSRQSITVPEQLDLNTFLTGMQGAIEHLMGDNVTVTVRPHNGCDALVIADRREIEGVVMSLATNANDAMPAGGTFRIKVAVSGNYVAVTFTDTGCGLSADAQEKVFEPFFTTRQDLGRLGLGLSVVHSVVTGCGGNIAIDSRLGHGAAVRIFLPLVQAVT